jgi:hypothetical protein
MLVLGLYTFTKNDQKQPSHWVLIGVLLLTMVMFRRWYSFFCVGFIVALLCEQTQWLLARRRFTLAEIASSARPLIITGGSAALLMLTLFWPRVRVMIGTNYADMYSAYRGTEPLWKRVFNIVHVFGVYPACLTMGALTVLVSSKEMRRIGVFLAVQSSAAGLLFLRTQDHSMQHYLLYAPAVLMSTSTAGIWLCGKKANSKVLKLAVSVMFIASIATWSAVYGDHAQVLHRVFGPTLPASAYKPYKRSDIAELIRLDDTLADLLAKEGIGDGVYVLSSSGDLNPDTLRNLSKSLNQPMKSGNRVYLGAHVDKRDGFPNDLLKCRLVIAADPPQYHLDRAGQQVVGIPVASFKNNTDIALAFRKHPMCFVLENGVTVFIYEKTRRIDKAEIALLSKRLQYSYPERPFIYRPDTQFVRE